MRVWAPIFAFVILILGCLVNNSLHKPDMRQALESSSADELKAVLKAGVDPNSHISVDALPPVLPLLCALGSPTKTELLLKAGAKVDLIKNETGMPALAWVKNAETANLLLGKGCKLDEVSDTGDTPLHYAASDQNAALVEFLLSKGANPNATNRYTGFAPLHTALGASSGKFDRKVIEVLLRYGANPSICDKKQRTPKDLVRESTWWNKSDRNDAMRMLETDFKTNSIS